MSTRVMKMETESESCAVCGGGGDLLTPEEHDAGAPPSQVPLRSILLQLNNNKVIPEGRLCGGCVRRALDAHSFSSALAARASPPLGERIRALRRKLAELTRRVDVFVVVGAPGAAYCERDVVAVERAALAADDDLERAPDAAGQPAYHCSVCPLTFQRAGELRAHAAAHPADARHSCWTCGAQFAERAALRQHARAHAPPAPLACHLCDATLQSVSALRAHEAACCARCPLCGAACGGRAALARHAARAHAGGGSGGGEALCPTCFARLPSRAALAQHALAHRRAERFVCGYDACILRFANRGDLMAHIRKCHSGEAAPEPEEEPRAAPPAPAGAAACPHCSRTFGSVGAMKRHARVHRRDEPPEGQTGEVGEAGEEWALDGHVEYLEMDALDL